MKNYDTVIFDLDGTLTDPGEGITRSVEYALGKFGISVSDRSELYRFIGPPLVDSFERFYPLSNAEARRAVDYYRERYSVVGLFENTPYPDIEKVLDALRSAGKRLFVATLKPTAFSVRILEHFGLSKYFELIAGAVMDNHTVETKADIIRKISAECGADLSRAIMIGDRHHDMEGARECGIDAIGVLWGYGGEKELLDTGATYIAKEPNDIITIVKEAASN